jgi:hypothetical protein
MRPYCEMGRRPEDIRKGAAFGRPSFRADRHTSGDNTEGEVYYLPEPFCVSEPLPDSEPLVEPFFIRPFFLRDLFVFRVSSPDCPDAPVWSEDRCAVPEPLPP